MNVIWCILVYIGVAAICIPSILKKKHWIEIVAVFVMLTLGVVLSVLQILDVHIPNPNKGIAAIIKAITGQK
ncbi:MAG: hypothetical protein R2876_04190 [Eubacteriales bacterium]